MNLKLLPFQVRWFKNGAPLSKEEGITSKRGNRHTLLLPGIWRRTFGDYECRASNKYGQDTSTTRVSGELQHSLLPAAFLEQKY